jgi:predicted ATPase
MKNAEKSAPMYFASLEIENVKCFGEKQILDLRNSKGALSRWTLILGDNGVGKTTLLKCLAWMKPVETPEKEEVKIAKKLKAEGIENSIITKATGLSSEEIENIENKENKIIIKPFMDDFDDEQAYEQLIRVGNDVKTRIGATFTNDISLDEIPTVEKLVSIGIAFERKNNKLEVVTPEFGKLSQFNSPNLYAYSASRHMALKNFEKTELRDPISNLFSESADLYDAEQVLSNLDYSSIREKIEFEEKKTKDGKSLLTHENIEKVQTSVEGKATALLSKVKLILKDLLLDINGPDWIIINPPLNKDGTKTENLVEIQTPYGRVSLYDLSLGYKTMLAWAVDLALRMLWRNPESLKPLEQPAVVIVDEIDLHLHPKWQRIVRGYLTKHFANTQFICTAHSPFMAQSSEQENLCVLNRVGDEVQIQNSPTIVQGWRIGQVITNLFGVSERSPEIDALINKRRIILDKKERTSEDDLELKDLDEKLSSLPIMINDNENDLQLLDQINKMAELLKTKGGLK